MQLYELHAHDTRSYNLKSQRTVRLREGHGRKGRIDKWVDDYFKEFPNGVVVQYEVVNQKWDIQSRRYIRCPERRRYVQTFTCEVTE